MKKDNFNDVKNRGVYTFYIRIFFFLYENHLFRISNANFLGS